MIWLMRLFCTLLQAELRRTSVAAMPVTKSTCIQVNQEIHQWENYVKFTYCVTMVQLMCSAACICVTLFQSRHGVYNYPQCNQKALC